MSTKPPIWLIFILALILALAVLLLIPSTQQPILSTFGFGIPSQSDISYNGFDAFIPFIPGVFPDNFQITHADTGSHISSTISRYSETYASDTHFFITIQRQGQAVTPLQPDPGFTIQDQPARLTDHVDLAALASEIKLDLNQFNTQEVWLVNVVLKGIDIQVVTNLPKAEAIQVADGLIPSICTSTPTPEG